MLLIYNQVPTHPKHTPASHSNMALRYLIPLAAFVLLKSSYIAEAQSAPAPESGPVNLTGILDKNGQYTTFIHLLTITQVGNQINNQLNSSSEGMTVFAPTDNAFNNLKTGTLNNLNTQQQVELVLYHVLPKFYTISSLIIASNPIRTQATGEDGGAFGLNCTGENNQLNVSTGVVETQVNNALRETFPLAVYEVDKVLLPEELFGNKTSSTATAPVSSTTSTTNSTSSTAASSPSSHKSASGEKNVAFGLVVGFALACMGLIS